MCLNLGACNAVWSMIVGVLGPGVGNLIGLWVPEWQGSDGCNSDWLAGIEMFEWVVNMGIRSL